MILSPAAQRCLLGLVLAALPVAQGLANGLPVPSKVFVTSGSASSPAVSGKSMTVRQHSPRATLNWDSFDIASGHAVDFRQPDASSIALNLIHQADPSVIRGSITANGEIWLVNQNGLVFGEGAAVDVRGLIASSLRPTAAALAGGIAPPTSANFDEASFAAPLLDGKPTAGDIRVASGATLQATAAGGRVFLFAPNVANEGLIKAEDGQVALAAGSQIFLRQPGAGEGPGLLVEVGDGGIVTNGAAASPGDAAKLLGQIVADRGTATLVGLSVNQQGRVSANAAVRAGGTIRLLARESRAVSNTASTVPTAGGTLTLGPGSVTSANPDPTDQSTAVDAAPRLVGSIALAGRDVVLRPGSTLEAHGGAIGIAANDKGDARLAVQDTAGDVPGRIVLESGSLIDVSGMRAIADATRSFLTVKLQGAELKDRPVQRDGALYGETLTVDLRKRGTLPDGTPWVGTPLADLTASAAAEVRRGNAERNSLGGRVDLVTQGGLLMAEGAVIDVSGGVVTYPATPNQSSLLLRNGQLYDVAAADPALAYEAVFGRHDVVHRKWGPTESWSLFQGGAQLVPGYSEGKDAGTLRLVAPSLLLEGALLGGTEPGVYQRQPTSLQRVDGLARPSNEAPRRGQLLIGNAVAGSERDPQFITPDVVLRAAAAGRLPRGFDALADPLPSVAREVWLDTDWFGTGRMGGLTVFSAGRVSLAADEALDLGAGGQLAIEAGSLSFDGKVLAPGGALTLATRDTSDPAWLTPSTGDLALGPNATLDVSGLWVNEHPSMNPDGLSGETPRFIAGGSLQLLAQGKSDGVGGLFLAPGSRLQADGGAVLEASGKLLGGIGGRISLGVRADPFGQRFPVPLALGASLSAYGLGKGGLLALEASSICIAASCGAPSPTRLDLEAGLFTAHGFAGFDLTATGGALLVGNKSALHLQQANLIPAPAAELLGQVTGTRLRSFATPGQLDDSQRLPVDLTLRVKAQNAANQFDDAALRAAGALELAEGSQLIADPGARLQFSSETRMLLDGLVQAPGGRIEATLASAISGSRLLSALPSQSLWVGRNARLDASGTFVRQPDSRGLASGRLFEGGSVSLAAGSGWLYLDPAAALAVNGAAADIDLLPSGSLFPVSTPVASHAGSISLMAAEGLFLGASLEANAAPGARPGSLAATLSAQRRNDAVEVPLDRLGLSTGPRVLSLAEAPMLAEEAGLGPGQPLPSSLEGKGVIATRVLQAAEFGDITLRALNYQRASGEGLVTGAVRLEAPASLQASRRLTLDAASLDLNGFDLSLAAPYVGLGAFDADAFAGGQAVAGAARPGGGRLDASADLLDLVGSWRLDGAQATRFRSEGDLRFRGIQRLNLPAGSLSTTGEGKLLSTGDLTFSARQAYPTTLTDYRVSVVERAAGRVEFEQAPGARSRVLAVGGALSVESATIRQGGTLRAPVGVIDLVAADTLDLLPGSVTSTSLEEAEALYGRLELGKDWVYLLDTAGAARARLVFSPQSNRAADPFPAPAIGLAGRAVNLQPGATIDQSGGGDLLAYEFSPGLLGSSDPLDAANTYALVPDLGALFAPFDPQEQLGFGLQPGETIELADGLPGLPAGRHALLPAHYALLPGAYLVTPRAGYLDLAPGETVRLAGVGTVLAGRRTFGALDQGDARWSGFLLRDASDLARLGKFSLVRASDFAGLAGQARPQDAGALRISASESLDLGARLLARTAAGGLGATTSITGSRIAVVADLASQPVEPGTLLLEAAGLGRLGASSLVLGGTLSGVGGERVLDVTAQSLELRAAARLQGADLTLVARDRITLAADAALRALDARGVAAPGLAVTGDGALVRVSGAAGSAFVRNAGPGATGSLEVREGARIEAAGSVVLDATRDLALEGDLTLEGDLLLGAPRITLGDGVDNGVGLTLSQSRLEQLSAGKLSLRARDGIELYPFPTLSFGELVLDTPGIAAGLGEDVAARITARRLTLANSLGGGLSVPAGAGGGALEFAVDDLVFGDTGGQAFEFRGFERLGFEVAKSALAVGDSRVGTTGRLTLTAPSLTAAASGWLRLEAGGALDFRSNGAAAVRHGQGAGGSLSLTGSAVSVDGPLLAPSGTISLHATGEGPEDDLSIESDALLDVSGQLAEVGSQFVATHGGRIRLLADLGSVRAAAGARLDLGAGAPVARAGDLSLAAPLGTVELATGVVTAEGSGGRFSLEASELAVPERLGDTLSEIAEAGLDGLLDVRLHQGDILVASTDRLRAAQISLAADTGEVRVAGLLDASGAEGGSIRLAAGEGIVIGATGSLLASTTTASGRGGNVSLFAGSASDGATPAGRIRLETGSVVDLSGGPGGLFHLRLPEASVLEVLGVGAAEPRLELSGEVSGALQTVVEGFRAYRDGLLEAAEIALADNPWFTAASTFAARVGDLRAALGVEAEVRFRPGIEIRSTSDAADSAAGDLSLAAIWDLSAWRFDGEPGYLTLRGAGNLAVRDILSDGFLGTDDLARSVEGKSVRCDSPQGCSSRPTVSPQLLEGESWSYRLVAGADLAAADPEALLPAVSRLRGGLPVGDFLLAGGTPSAINPVPGLFGSPVFRPILNAVRTGTGEVRVVAAGDITLGNRAAVLYTGGRAAADGVRLGATGIRNRDTLQLRPWSEQGGDLFFEAGGNVFGVDPALAFDEDNAGYFPRQLVGSWLVRQGNESRATGWTAAPEFFEAGVAALAGGDITLEVAGDVRDLSLASVAIGKQVGGATRELDEVEITGGGDLRVATGGDLLGGVFHVGKGRGRFDVGGSISNARGISPGSETLLYPVLSLGEATFELAAGRGIDLGGAVSASFIPQGPFQKQLGLGRQNNAYFIGYGRDSAVRLATQAGDITLHDTAALEASAFETDFSLLIDSLTLRLMPPVLEAVALGGNINLEQSLTLMPSPAGDLRLLAGGSIYLRRALAMSDTDPGFLPSVVRPGAYSDADLATALLSAIDPENPTQQLASTPTHAEGAGSPAVLAAGDDIVTSEGALLFLAKSAQISAGRDLLNPNAIIEHASTSDLTQVVAGRDLRYESPRVPTRSTLGVPGTLLRAANSLRVWGPGRLLVETGHDLELGTAGGIVSEGSTVNAALAGEGAAIALLVGLQGQQPAYDAFIDRYFTPGSDYLEALAAGWRALPGQSDLTSEEALAQLRGLSREAQAAPVLDAFFAELRATGRAAAATTTPDYARGDEAIDTLLSDETYAGNLNLYFSRVFTRGGGGIDAVVPGGGINVGLASPPASFGIAKSPGELGIVSEGFGDLRAFLRDNFDVNESRMMAADGGSILVWSNLGDIDAGRGARSALSIPPNGFQFDNEGRLSVSVPPAIQGSGIRALTTTPGRPFGSVDLVTPRGVVNASEAGIESAGNIVIAAVEVLGAENIKAGGASVGVPSASVGAIGASVAGAAGAASAAAKASSDAAGNAASRDAVAASAAAETPAIISVEFLGFGDG